MPSLKILQLRYAVFRMTGCFYHLTMPLTGIPNAMAMSESGFLEVK